MMNFDLSRFTHSLFVRHAAILQAGGMLRYGLIFFTSVAAARILGPADYGVWALALALSGFFGTFFDVGQGSSLTLLVSGAHARGDARELFRTFRAYLKTNVFLFVLAGLPAILAAPLLGRVFYGRENIGEYARVVIAANFLAAGFTLAQTVSQVLRRMKVFTALDNADQIAKSVSILALLWLGFGVWGMAGGQFMGTLVSAAVAILVYRRLARTAELFPRLRDLAKTFLQERLWPYIRYSLPLAVDRNLAGLYELGTVLILGRLVSVGEIGLFKIALGYAAIAMLLLSPASRLLQDQFPKDLIRNPALLRRNFITVSVFAGLIGASAGLALILLAPYVIPPVYGSSFAGAVLLVRSFWAYLAIAGFGVGLGSIYRVLNRALFPVKLHIVMLSFGIPLTWYLADRFGAVGAIYGYTVMKGGVTLIAFFSILRFLRWEVLKSAKAP